MSSNRTTAFFESLYGLPSRTLEQNPISNTRQIAIEEANIEKAIIEAITRGEFHTLKPNSGEAIPIGQHYVCVSFHDEGEPECRAWEWHGHILSYNEERGFTQEYVYGNYFQRTMGRVFPDESDEERDVALAFRDSIGGIKLMGSRFF